MEGEGTGDVVGDLRANRNGRESTLQGLAGCFEGGGADVDGLVEDLRLEAGERAEEDAGLGGGAGAEFGEGEIGREVEEDLVGVDLEQGALGAGEVVLGERGDLLEEAGALLVVEEPRGKRAGRRGEAGAGLVCDFGGDFGRDRRSAFAGSFLKTFPAGFLESGGERGHVDFLRLQVACRRSGLGCGHFILRGADRRTASAWREERSSGRWRGYGSQGSRRSRREG